MQKIKITV